MPEHATPAVVLLIFNRPETTQAVFERIAAAQPARLLIVADGPRSDRPEDAAGCAAARSAVERINWPCDVQRNYAEANLGCGRRVASGLDWAFSLVEEAIILEDDCLPHPNFFSFCGALLERYRHDTRLMMIAGTNPLRRVERPADYLFSRYYNIWGWATWRRAWALYDAGMHAWPRRRAGRPLERLYGRGAPTRALERLFDRTAAGLVDTWDAQWFATCLFQSGLSAVPRVNLISNIGALGTHAAGKSDPNLGRPTYPLDTAHLRHPADLLPDQDFDAAVLRQEQGRPLAGQWRRLAAGLRRRLRR